MRKEDLDNKCHSIVFRYILPICGIYSTGYVIHSLSSSPTPTLHCGCGRTVVSPGVSVGFPNLERMDSWEMMETIIYMSS